MPKIDFKSPYESDKVYVNEILDMHPQKDDPDYADKVARRNELEKALVDEYPFLALHGNADDDLVVTWFDMIPDGWRKAFGLEFLRDLKDALGGAVKNYEVLDVKEKWGLLDWMGSINNDLTDNVLTKYELLSERTCIECGKPATRITTGWICPYCDDCNKDWFLSTKTPDEFYGPVGRDYRCTKYLPTSPDGMHRVEILKWNWDVCKWENDGVRIFDEKFERHFGDMYEALRKLGDPKVSDIIDRNFFFLH